MAGRERLRRAFLLTVLLLLLLPATSPGQGQGVPLDDCGSTERWSAAGEPYGPVEIAAGPFTPREGERCLRLKFPGSGIAWLRFEAGQAWSDHAALSFWLRVQTSGRRQWTLRLGADADDNTFSIDARILLDFAGWQRVRLEREDFEVYLRRGDAQVDWSKIRQFSLGLMEGDDKPTLYIDDVRYEQGAPRPDVAAPRLVSVSACDATAGWKWRGVAVEAVTEPRVAGTAALRLSYDGITTGRLERHVDATGIGERHALAFHLRAPGASTAASLRVELGTRSGGLFQHDLEIHHFEMRRYLLFPGRFRMVPDGDGAPPRWSEIVGLAFVLNNPDAGESGHIVIDDIRLEPMAASPLVAPRQGRFWWWDGGFDPFAAMHVIDADWPHPIGDPRAAPIRFSETVLGPLVPYRIELHGDGEAERLRVTIMDWPMNVLDRFVAPGSGVFHRDLVAPARTGTRIFQVEWLDGGGAVRRTYRTGVNVVAKRLREPRGIWGFHGFLGSKGSHWPHHEQVLTTLQQFGTTVLRERVQFVRIAPDDIAKVRSGPQGRVLARARSLDMTTVAAMTMGASPDLWAGRYNVVGMKEGAREAVVDTMASIAGAYAGLVDWWEVGNEPNEHPIGPYARVLAACYEGAKRGDPDARVVMGGSHVIDRWQVQAWDLERRTGVPHQDALATHLYPDPATLEETLRSWISAQGDALLDKGMLMTEAGWPTFPFATQALHRQGLLPAGYSGERASQDWYLRYAPVILGEHLKLGADLFAVCFFRTTPSMGDWVFRDGNEVDLLVHCKGHFAARWGSREITMGRPMAYAHNTIARLLTHEVELDDVPVRQDERSGRVEHYAFRRPGETIVALWSGVRRGGRAERVEAIIALPEGTGLALACDADGNERVVAAAEGSVSLQIRRGEPQYLRLLRGRMAGPVFIGPLPLSARPDDLARQLHLVQPTRVTGGLTAALQRWRDAGIGHGPTPHPTRVNVYVGTPRTEPAIAIGVSRDRGLPVVSDTVPLPRAPFVLYSASERALFVVGQDDEDLSVAVGALRAMLTDARGG